jgi:hypothetical protein
VDLTVIEDADEVTYGSEWVQFEMLDDGHVVHEPLIARPTLTPSSLLAFGRQCLTSMILWQTYVIV